jgi:hypothetical protein
LSAKGGKYLLVTESRDHDDVLGCFVRRLGWNDSVILADRGFATRACFVRSRSVELQDVIYERASQPLVNSVWTEFDGRAQRLCQARAQARRPMT